MEGIIFSFPYLIFTGLLMVLTLTERMHQDNSLGRQFTHFSCIALYLVFVGLRGYIGTDWYNYQLIFDAVPTLFSGEWTDFRAENLLEPGFVIFTSMVKTLWNNYHFFVFVSACIDMAILNLFLKRYVSWYTLGFLVFFVMGGLTLCDLMRNVRSIGLFLLSLRYLTERRPWIYFGLNLLGMCFHITSVFYIPLYWVLHRRWSRWILAGVFLVGNFVFLVDIEFVRPMIAWGAEMLGGRFAYLQAQYLLDEVFNESYRISIGYLERILTTVLVFVLYDNLIKKRESNVLFVNSYVLYILFFFFFAEIREFAARLSLLFMFSYWVLIPELYETFRGKLNRGVFLSVLGAYCLLKIAGMTAIPLYRYDNLLWGIENYDRRVDEFDRYYLNR